MPNPFVVPRGRVNNKGCMTHKDDFIDIEGNPTGGYTVILTKKEAQATQNKQPGFKAGGFQKKAFTSNKSFGNRQY